MKKVLCIVTTLCLLLTLGLSGCNKTKTTIAKKRWTPNESFTYNVTLAEISPNDNEHFVSHDGYYRDYQITGIGVTESKLTTMDEIVPNDITGTYKTTLSTNTQSGICTYTTVRDTTAKYDTADLQQYDCYDDLQKLATVSGDETLLHSTTKSVVQFDNGDKQSPNCSYTIVIGYYVGHAHQGLSCYLNYTTYNGMEATVYKLDLSGSATAEEMTNVANQAIELISAGNGQNVPNVSIDTYQINNGKSASYVDSNQILMYLRSLTKDSDCFQDNPSILIFDSYTGTTRKATFSFNYAHKTQLQVAQPTQESSGYLNTVLNLVNVIVDGHAFISQTNLPDNLSESLDKLSTDGLCKYTTTTFRVGYCSYSLDTSYFANNSGLATALSSLIASN